MKQRETHTRYGVESRSAEQQRTHSHPRERAHKDVKIRSEGIPFYYFYTHSRFRSITTSSLRSPFSVLLFAAAFLLWSVLVLGCCYFYRYAAITTKLLNKGCGKRLFYVGHVKHQQIAPASCLLSLVSHGSSPNLYFYLKSHLLACARDNKTPMHRF
jgi:hypothetical protein